MVRCNILLRGAGPVKKIIKNIILPPIQKAVTQASQVQIGTRQIGSSKLAVVVSEKQKVTGTFQDMQKRKQIGSQNPLRVIDLFLAQKRS